MELLAQTIPPKIFIMGFLNEAAKFIFYLSALRLHSCPGVPLCALRCDCKLAHIKGSAEHLPLYSLCTAVLQAGCLPSKVSAVFDCCLTEPQTGTLDTVQWCLINANAPDRPVEEGERKKISNDCLLCLCVAMTVKPLFDHSQ